jgi:hypothetical protein
MISSLLIRSLLVFASTLASYQLTAAQKREEPAHYNYYIAGTVLDENSKPAVGIYVCLWPQRPLGGRLACTQTEKDGRYALRDNNIPDKYSIGASDSQLVVLVGDKHSHRSGGSGVFDLGPRDESRTIDIKLTLYIWSDKEKKLMPVQKRIENRETKDRVNRT